MATADTWGMGHGLAYGPATFTDTDGLEYSAPFMAEGTVWKLVLSPPDPNAGVWYGTIGAAGVINWPSAIDPTGGDCGLDDPFPAGLQPTAAGGFLNAHQVDTGVVPGLDTGDAVPLTPGPIRATLNPNQVDTGVVPGLNAGDAVPLVEPPPPPPAFATITAIQFAAGFERIWDFQYPVAPLADSGVLAGVHSYGVVGPITPTAPIAGGTINIASMPLIPAGGPRTLGNYDDTLATADLLSAEITEAWNDPANYPMGLVAIATDLVGSVLFTAVVEGTAGNTIGFTGTDPINQPRDPSFGSLWYGVDGDPANLTIENDVAFPWLNENPADAPATPKTLGRYWASRVTLDNLLYTDLDAANVARTGDIFWEAIFSGNTAFLSVNGTMMLQAGRGGAGLAQTHSTLWFDGNNVQLYAGSPFDAPYTPAINVPQLTQEYMSFQPTYIAVWWDHTNSVYRLYFRKRGQPEVVLTSAVHPAGSAGNEQFRFGGGGASASFRTHLMRVHMGAFHRAALTPEHRHAIYTAMGILPEPTAITAIQIADTFSHIYDFDASNIPTADKGILGNAPLTVEGIWTNAPPTVPGTAGSFENVTAGSLANFIHTDPETIVVARFVDQSYELIVELPTTPTASDAFAIVGNFNKSDSHSFLKYFVPFYVDLFQPDGSGALSADFLTADFLLDPTYIGVWWDETASVYHLYYRKIGQPEVEVVSSVLPGGFYGLEQLFIGGDGVIFPSLAMKIHMFALKSGEITPAHRQNIYTAMGI